MQRSKELPVQQFIPEFAVEAFIISILPWAARFNIERFDFHFIQPAFYRFGRKFCTVITADMIRQPRVINKSSKASRTSPLLSLRFVTMAKHSRVYSSITVSILKDRPSWVRSCTKSYAQTWFFHDGRRRTQEPSFSHKRLRLGCFNGTLSPSRRQIRATRL